MHWLIKESAFYIFNKSMVVIFRMKKALSYFIIFILTLSVLFLHLTENVDTMINNHNHSIDNKYLSHVVQYHRDNPVFSKRPVVTSIIYSFDKLFHTGLGVSLVTVSFSFLFLSGVLLFRLSELIINNFKLSLLNVLLYFLCASNLFAFFPPVFT